MNLLELPGTELDFLHDVRGRAKDCDQYRGCEDPGKAAASNGGVSRIGEDESEYDKYAEGQRRKGKGDPTKKGGKPQVFRRCQTEEENREIPQAENSDEKRKGSVNNLARIPIVNIGSQDCVGNECDEKKIVEYHFGLQITHIVFLNKPRFPCPDPGHPWS